VLIIDDERDFALSVADILEARGYEPVLAHDAASAEARQADLGALVALIDVRLAGDSGFALLATLRVRYPRMLCVMMTAYADVDSAVRALQNGAYDFLRKPFDAAELLAALERCFSHARLDEEKQAAEATLRKRNAELAEVNARLRMMVDAAGRLPRCNEVEELSRQVLSEFSGLMAAEGGSLYLCETQALRLAATMEDQHAQERIPLPLPAGSVLGRVLARRETVLVRDLSAEPGLVPSGWDGYRDGSLIVFPVLRDGAVLALVSLHNKTRPPFTEQDRDLGRVMISFAAEVLDAQRAHTAVRESESRYRTLFDSAGDGILILHDGVYVDVNRKAAEIFGCRPDEIAGKRPWELSPPAQADGNDSRSAAHHRLSEAAAGRPQAFEWRHRRADGAEFDADVTLNAVDLSGATHVQAIIRDVTLRKRTEAQLLRLATAVEHADEDIMITDASGAIGYVNPAFERVTGYARGEALGKNPRFLKSGVHGADFYTALWGTLSAGRTWSGRFTNRCKDGALILQEASISPLLDEAGRIQGYVSVKRDVTHQVSLERHLADAQRMDALGTLAGGIAHDFNNILSAVLGSVDLGLRSVDADSKPAHYLRNIRLAAQRAANLTRQILAFSRRGPQEFRPTELRAVVDEALSLLRASLPTTIEIRRRLQTESTVRADGTQLHQVLMNLGTNAGLAMHEHGGVLEVAVEDVVVDADLAGRYPGLVPGAYVRLTVRDTGVGMTPEVMAHVFEPFFTTRPRGEGTGMGLAVVHGIVRNHGGSIHVNSTPGAGTTVEIHLPALEAATAVAPAAVGPPPRGTERVLLVDDDRLQREVTREMLGELGYQVTCCPDGCEALETIRGAPGGFDLVLSDITMPRLTGDALAREVQRLSPPVPVILSTGFAERWTPEAARAAGARALLLKPATLWDLAIAVRRALDDRENR
jgi:PAS domain S-box-containing protein